MGQGAAGFWNWEDLNAEPRRTTVGLDEAMRRATAASSAQTPEQLFDIQPAGTRTLRTWVKDTVTNLAHKNDTDKPNPVAVREIGNLMDAFATSRKDAGNNLARIHKALPDDPQQRQLHTEQIIDSHLLRLAMNVQQLEAFHQAVQGKLNEPDCDPLLALIAQRVEGALVRLNPALHPQLQEKLRAAIDDARIVHGELTVALYPQALLLASQLGAPVNEVVLDAIAYLFSKGVNPEDVTHFLMTSLTPSQLDDLAKKPGNDHGAVSREAVGDLARACYEHCRQNALAGFSARLETLGEWRHDPEGPTVAEPAQLAICVNDLAAHLRNFRAYGGSLTPEQATGIQTVGPLLAKLVNPKNLRHVTEAPLKLLQAALPALGFSGIGGVDQAVAARTEAKRAIHMASSLSVVMALHSLGGSTATAADVVNAIRAAIAQRSRSKLNKGMGAFPAELREQIEAMTPQARIQLTKVMQSPRVRELEHGLRELTRTAVVKEYDMLAAELHELQHVLTAVHAEVAPGADVGELLPRGISGIAELSPELRTAFAHYGIEIDKGNNVSVRFGVAPPSLQKVANEIVATRMVEPRRDSRGLRFPSGAFYQVNGEDLYKRKALLSADKTVSQRESDRGTAVLTDLAGGSPALLSSLLHFMDTRTLQGIEAALRSPATPLRSDGDPIELVGDSFATFNATKDSNGGVRLRCWLTINNVTGALIIGATENAKLAASAREEAEFRLDLAFSPDGNVTLAGPLEFRHGRGYTIPTNASEVTQANANQFLETALRRHLVREFSSENLDVIAALNEFERNPSMAEARRLASIYIVPGAQSQVNIGQPQAAAVLEALKGPDLDREELGVLFDAVRAEIGKLVNTDSFTRFVRDVKAAASEDSAAQAVADNLNAAAAQAVMPAGAAAEPAAGWPRPITFLGTDLTILSRPLNSRDALDKAVDRLLSSLRNMSAEDRSTFPSYVQWRARTRPVDEHASLLYNLQNSVVAPPGAEPYLKMVRAAALGSLEGSPEAGMTPEGVLIGDGRAALTHGILVHWFSEKRISEDELAMGLSRLTDGNLKMIVKQEGGNLKIMNIAKRMLDARKLASQLAIDLKKFVEDGLPPRAPAPTANAVLLLAEQLSAYQALHMQLGQPPGPLHESVRALLKLLPTRLKGFVASFDGQGMNDAQLRTLGRALTVLGGPRIDRDVLNARSMAVAVAVSLQAFVKPSEEDPTIAMVLLLAGTLNEYQALHQSLGEPQSAQHARLQPLLAQVSARLASFVASFDGRELDDLALESLGSLCTLVGIPRQSIDDQIRLNELKVREVREVREAGSVPESKRAEEDNEPPPPPPDEAPPLPAAEDSEDDATLPPEAIPLARPRR